MVFKYEQIKIENIVGTWQLERFDLQRDDGSVYCWGFDTYGLLIYSPSGQMSVSISRLAPWEPGGFSSVVSDVQNQNLFYTGLYFIEDGVVRHQVKQAVDPDRVGTTLAKTGLLSNGLLTFFSKQQDSYATLVWRKLQLQLSPLNSRSEVQCEFNSGPSDPRI